MSGKRWFWLAVALQVAILLGMGARHGYTLRTGQTIRLQTAPVDPWELFRGQYVQLSYTISSLRSDSVTMTGGPYRRGQPVWVTLRRGDPYWTAVALAAGRPAVSDGEVALRGTVQWVIPAIGAPVPQPEQVNIRYGIEQFYVPEGAGQGLQGQAGKITVEAKVDGFGRAALSRLFVDGKEVQWR